MKFRPTLARCHKSGLPIVVALMTLATASAFARADQTMPVGTIVEERMHDDDMAVVLPKRLQLECRIGANAWGFAFAGFQTQWRGPIELEVSGSGNYQSKDKFSLAAIGLDFGKRGGGWSERAFWGLGKIQETRAAHPPGWGVGGGGKMATEGNLVDAGKQTARVEIDPAKAAPADWDGRLWIGLYLHNVGEHRWVKVRILNGGVGDAPEPPEQAKWQAIVKHQKEFLEHAVRTLQKQPENAVAVDQVAEEVRPYAQSSSSPQPRVLEAMQLQTALKSYDRAPAGAEGFFHLAEGYFATERQTPDGEDRVGELNDFAGRWKKGGSFGREIGCIVRVASNLEKVGLGDVKIGRIETDQREPIQISAAKHEYEGFQIVLTPIAGANEDVALSVSELRSKQGGTIPAPKVNAVGYVRIYPNQPRETLMPDPLLAGPIPRLAPGENQPVWVTVRVPSDAAAGLYNGTVTIAARRNHVEIPLVVRVRDFAIPKKISLRSSFWMFRDQINRFYHLKEVKLDDYFKWIDLALEHRVNPIDVFEGHCSQLLDVVLDPKTHQASRNLRGVPNPKPDFTQWDKYIDRMIAGGANTIHLGQTHHEGAMYASDPKEISTPKQIDDVIETLKILEDHYAKRGILSMHYLQLRDETSEPNSLNVYREVKKRLPKLKLLLTAPSNEARPLLDIPCPLTPHFDAGWRDEVHQRGDEYWWYVCVAPRDTRYANFFLEQQATQHRALFWQTWSHDVDGLLYWGMDFWSGYDSKWPAGATGPTKRVPGPNDPNFCPLADAPGDGFSMYPGPTPSQPLSSVRLEIIRDGEEDYEYLKILDKLIASRGGSSQAVNHAKALEEQVRKTFANMTQYPLDAQTYQTLRDRVADAIEALEK